MVIFALANQINPIMVEQRPFSPRCPTVIGFVNIWLALNFT